MSAPSETVAQAIERRKKEGHTHIQVNGKDAVFPETWFDFEPYDGSMDDWIVDIEVDWDGSSSSIWIEAHDPTKPPLTREGACKAIDEYAEAKIKEGADAPSWREAASRAKKAMMDPKAVKDKEIGLSLRLIKKFIKAAAYGIKENRR